MVGHNAETPQDSAGKLLFQRRESAHSTKILAACRRRSFMNAIMALQKHRLLCRRHFALPRYILHLYILNPPTSPRSPDEKTVCGAARTLLSFSEMFRQTHQRDFAIDFINGNVEQRPSTYVSRTGGCLQYGTFTSRRYGFLHQYRCVSSINAQRAVFL